MAISDYYYKLSDKQQTEFKMRVLNETGMAYSTFYTKLKEDKWRKSERVVINSIIEDFEKENAGED